MAHAPQTADDPYPVPEVLRPNIAFWIRVFTELDSSSGVLHDAGNVTIIYQTLTSLPPSSRRRRRLIDRRRQYYRHLLLSLAKNKGRPRSKEEQRVLARFAKRPTPAALRAAAKSIRFQAGLRHQFAQGLARSGAYMADMGQIFLNADLPPSLTLLPHIESSFNNKAYSKAGAAGIWQFMRYTGKLFLTIDEAIDERLDVRRATMAAAQLLRLSYQRLGTWPLAITAYNHGTQGMQRAVAQLGTTDFGTIVQRYRSPTFGFASKNFYAAFLAVVAIVRDHPTWFPDLTFDTPTRYHTLVLDAYVALPTLATHLGLDHRDLLRWNPALRPPVAQGALHVPKGMVLHVPAARLEKADLQARWATIPSRLKFARQRQPTMYRVRTGDTLSGLARRMGTSVAKLAQLNQLRRPYLIRAGQKLKLPHDASINRRYRVRAGDTLWTLARRVGTTVAVLAQLNDLERPYKIRVGQILTFPPVTTQTARR